MTRPFNPIQLLLPAVLLFFVTCNKHLTDTATVKTDLGRCGPILRRFHFNPGYPHIVPPSQKLTRSGLVLPVGQGQGIQMPIVFDNALLMKANFVGDPYFHLSYLTQLLFYKDSTGKNTARVITRFPDSNYFKDPTGPFTGIKFVEDWDGHPIEKILYTPGRQNQTVYTEFEPTFPGRGCPNLLLDRRL